MPGCCRGGWGGTRAVRPTVPGPGLARPAKCEAPAREAGAARWLQAALLCCRPRIRVRVKNMSESGSRTSGSASKHIRVNFKAHPSQGRRQAVSDSEEGCRVPERGPEAGPWPGAERRAESRRQGAMPAGPTAPDREHRAGPWRSRLARAVSGVLSIRVSARHRRSVTTRPRARRSTGSPGPQTPPGGLKAGDGAGGRGERRPASHRERGGRRVRR